MYSLECKETQSKTYCHIIGFLLFYLIAKITDSKSLFGHNYDELLAQQVA